jgi:DNA-binding response OmpR family regulator
VPGHLGTVHVLHGATMKTILVIDDKDEIRSVVIATLAHAGYAVRQARNGRDGILMVLAQRPDLILCDVRMPEMDGYRTLAAIRECRGTAAIPFILMVCGADDYLMKPFTAHELVKAVKSRLARHTHVQTEAYQRIEKLREPALLPRLPDSAPAGASMAVAA